MKNVLIMAKLPPPVTGATKMSQVIVDSKLINKKFDLKIFSINYPTNNSDYGKVRFSKIVKFFSHTFKLFKILILSKVDLIYFTLTPNNFPFFRDAFFIFIMKLFNKKIIIHMHGYGVQEFSKKSLVYRYVYKLTFKKVNVICLSSLITYDIKSVFNGDPFVVNYGLKDRFFKQNIINGLDKNNKYFKILFLSNYIKAKGIIDFIHIIDCLVQKGYNVKAEIVGNPSDYTLEYISEYINKKKLKQIIQNSGPKYKKEKDEVFLNSDIFVFPTHWESFGVVALEAMMFGLPVVASNVGSLPFIIKDGVTGYLSKKTNINDFADKIAQLLDDENKLKEFSKSSRERFLELFKINKYEEGILSAFNDVIEK